MMPRIITVFAAFFTSFLLAQNIIKDPDFDKGSTAECHFSSHKGTMEAKIVTEDGSWNKCLQVKLLGYKVDEKTGRKVEYAVVWFGKDGGKNPGFKVEPHTIYEFQFELKGTVVPIVRFTEWKSEDFWKGMKDIKATLPQKPVPSNEWSVVKGTFQVGPDAKYAALSLALWGNEQWGNLHPIGSYYMVDKVQIRPKASLLPPKQEAASGTVSEKTIEVPCIIPGKTYSGFYKRSLKEPAQADTSYSYLIKDGKMLVNVRCEEPMMQNLAAKVTGDSAKVWSDDCVEIFVSSKDKSRRLNQFVVAAGGGRWMGRGSSGDVKEYSKWKSSVGKEKDAWTVDVELPFSLLGWDKAPADDEAMRVLIARNRIPVKETSSSAFVKDGFHAIVDWCHFFPNGAEAWGKAQKRILLEKAKSFEKLSAEIAKWIPGQNPAANMAKVDFFNERILNEGLSGRKFVLTKNPITSDTQIPFIPESLANPPKSISDRAAGNELHWVPLAITNLTEKTEEYRVVISAINPDTVEKWQLETKDCKLVYPPEKIRLYRAIRVKDGDEASHGRRYDTLVPMDLSQTIVVPPRESAPVFVQFNTEDVAPAVYEGMVRVIPLGEEGTLGKKNPSYRDTPFSFEVLPFQLSKKQVVRHFMYQEARNKEEFKLMVDSDINVFTVNVWTASFRFADDGSIIAKDTKKMEEKIKDYMAWAKEYGVEDRLEICLHYAVYHHYVERFTKTRFKPFTPAWEKAWVNCIMELDAVREKCGFPNDKWEYEIEDEPKEPRFPILIRAVELACKAKPSLRFMITLGIAEIPPETLNKMVPYVHEWCFWNTRFFLSKEYAPLIERLRKENKLISTYTCATSMRASLQRYFRYVPWTVPYFNLGSHNFYEHSTHKYRTRSWREATCGELVIYSNGHPVTTIRNECLKAGMIDLKYLALLKQCQEKAGKDSALGKKIGTFIEKTTYAVIMNPPEDPLHFEKIREEMINLILEAQK